MGLFSFLLPYITSQIEMSLLSDVDDLGDGKQGGEDRVEFRR